MSFNLSIFEYLSFGLKRTHQSLKGFAPFHPFAHMELVKRKVGR